MILRWGYFPTEVREAVTPILRSYLWLVPGWCRQLYVGYTNEGEIKGDASTSGEVEYRQAYIFFHPGWLDCDPTQRRLEVIHELLHIPLMPMTSEHDELVERLFDDAEAPKFKQTVQEQWRKSLEGTTQDLAFAILGIPVDSLPAVSVVEVEDEHPPLREVA